MFLVKVFLAYQPGKGQQVISVFALIFLWLIAITLVQSLLIDTYFTLNLFNLGDDQVQFELKDFIMENNKFVIDVPMHNLLTFTFDRYTHHTNVRFQNNTIQLNPGAKAADTWYSDITVNDTSIGSDSKVTFQA